MRTFRNFLTVCLVLSVVVFSFTLEAAETTTKCVSVKHKVVHKKVVKAQQGNCALLVNGRCIDSVLAVMNINTEDMDIVINGNVNGNVETGSGNVNVLGYVGHDATTHSGDILVRDVVKNHINPMTTDVNINDMYAVNNWATANNMRLMDDTGKTCTFK